jgi:hypothetical protein
LRRAAVTVSATAAAAEKAIVVERSVWDRMSVPPKYRVSLRRQIASGPMYSRSVERRILRREIPYEGLGDRGLGKEPSTAVETSSVLNPRLRHIATLRNLVLPGRATEARGYAAWPLSACELVSRSVVRRGRRTRVAATPCVASALPSRCGHETRDRCQQARQ